MKAMQIINHGDLTPDVEFAYCIDHAKDCLNA
jgi:hypothetical protein